MNNFLRLWLFFTTKKLLLQQRRPGREWRSDEPGREWRSDEPGREWRSDEPGWELRSAILILTRRPKQILRVVPCEKTDSLLQTYKFSKLFIKK